MLAWAATRHARQSAGLGARLFHDERWFHCIDDVCVPERGGFQYFANSPDIWRQSLAIQLRNAEDYWFHVYRPQPGHVIVDIGAGGLGIDILAFSKAVGPRGRVVAVEAHPLGAGLLARFCRLNDLANVTTVHGAVSDRPGVVQIADLDEHEANMIDPVAPSATSTFDVAASTFDDFCAAQGISRIDFLKMNIEGAEQLAIRGMSTMIGRIGHVCIACHDFRSDRGEGEFFRTRQTVIAFLRDHGFEVVERADDARDYVRDHVHAFRAADRAGT